MDNTKPCSCGGSNENCSRCYGRGFIRVNAYGRLREPKRGGKYNIPRPPSPPPTSNTIAVAKCQLCDFTGTMEGYLVHFAQWHTSNRRFKKRRRAANKRPLDSSVQCLKCRQAMSATMLSSHFANAHSVKSKPVFGLPHNLITCQECGCQVSARRLTKHIRKVHRGGAKSQRRYLARATAPASNRTQEIGKADRLDRWKDDLQAGQSPFQPNLDATKLYAHAYRENGRYGSHPSHDGFDDDSKA
jgi:hypothetical protein